ncbi:peptidase S66, LD-carboxypeptidase A [Mollisia scopiformis]|uniref:Peptidase S66, LD-carboxypeptidase A n=1 Tax=Mollisia scopiformis TaxID=149040 RepID=A0A132B7W8_MOLSC|nr:peptidase S66, LD-carboxypeptidase A [Mollisia scopiformis]KUJ07777.1 peptidase S66, LD-carboxypeptidase A [Mollisia scopiformis]
MSTHDNTEIIPAALKPGDTIALLSPSSRLNDIFPLRISRATTALEVLGFKIKSIYTSLPTPCSHHQQIHHRVQELHSAFTDPSIRAIISTIGGLSSNELLPFIDWDLIRTNPKIFVGYSDITLLHLGIFAQAGLRTFYGPAAITQFAEIPEPLGFTVEHFLHVLSPRTEDVGKPVGRMPRSEVWTDEFGDWGNEDKELKARKLERNDGWKWLRKGECEGRMTGGCLPSLLQLAGTRYWPSFQGKILLLENPEGERPDGPLPLEQSRSLMADLVNVGVLDEISGLVVGRPTGYQGEELKGYEKVVLGICSGVKEDGTERNFPILFGVDVGHTDPMLTVPLNAMTRLSSEEDVWEVLEPSVS